MLAICPVYPEQQTFLDPGRHFAFGPTADIVALGGGLIVGNTADNVGSAVQTAEEAGFLVVHVDEPT